MSTPGFEESHENSEYFDVIESILTPFELKVFYALFEGQSQVRIAKDTGKSRRTIVRVVNRIFTKLGRMKIRGLLLFHMELELLHRLPLMRDSDLIRALNLYLRHGAMHATRQSTPDTPVIKQDLRMMLRNLYVDEENSSDHSEN
jgi:hypothetical protein